MKTVCILTLGCKVNQYESNQIASRYRSNGFDVVRKFIDNADEYVINACSVTGHADKKMRNLVARVKRVAGNKPVTVCGCGIDRTLNDSLTEWAEQPRSRAFIKVQDGCNNFCSYCIVPYLRGRSRSRTIDDVIAEIKATGKPCVITGIDLSSFGLDNGSSLLQLCMEVSKCDIDFELSSIEVGILTDEFLAILKSCKRFIPKFHVPMQSGSDKVLKDMNRKYSAREYHDAIARIRKYFPNACISTDVIIGYPTETPLDLQYTEDLIRKCNFAHVHRFPYSDRNLEQFKQQDIVSYM